MKLEIEKIITESFSEIVIYPEHDEEEQVFNALKLGYDLVERHKTLVKGEHRYRVCTPMHPFGYEASIVVVVKEGRLNVIKFTKYHNS